MYVFVSGGEVDIRRHDAVGSFCFSEPGTPFNKYSPRVELLLIIL